MCDDGKDLHIFVRKVVNLSIHFGPVEVQGVNMVFSQSNAPIGAIHALGLKIEDAIDGFVREPSSLFIRSKIPLDMSASSTRRRYFEFVENDFVEATDSSKACLIVYSVAFQQQEISLND